MAEDQFTFQEAVVFNFFDNFLPGTSVPLGNELPDFASASGEFAAYSVALQGGDEGFEGEGFILTGEITSATARIVRQVPEPATGTLMLAAFAGFVMLRRRAPGRRQR